MKPNTKRLSINRTTLRNLSESEMSDAAGGTIRTIGNPCTIITRPTLLRCPSLVDGCATERACTIQTLTGNTSIINPGTV